MWISPTATNQAFHVHNRSKLYINGYIYICQILLTEETKQEIFGTLEVA